MQIMNNINAINTHRFLKINNNSMQKSMEKLSTGLRINRAGDDAAGLSISEKMRGQIRGLNMAAKNSLDGISYIQTAEGALNEVHSIAQRMRELTVQAANDTNTTADRLSVEVEVARLIDELDKIITETDFNTKKIFLGLDSEPVVIQVGANQGQTMDITIKKSMLPSFGYFAWEAPSLLIGNVGDQRIIDLSDHTKASEFISVMDKTINDISNERSKLGAYQNRLEHTLANLQVASENLTASESRIRDTDMAKEMLSLTKSKILEQSTVAMLTQANQQPQKVLELLS